MFETALTITLWGFWAFFSKLATKHEEAHTIFALQVIAGCVTCITVGIVNSKSGHIRSVSGLTIGLLAGFCQFLGTLLFILCLEKHSSSLVISLTSLYPLVAIILSMMILGDQLTFQQCSGIILAVLGIVLIQL